MNVIVPDSDDCCAKNSAFIKFINFLSDSKIKKRVSDDQITLNGWYWCI